MSNEIKRGNTEELNRDAMLGEISNQLKIDIEVLEERLEMVQAAPAASCAVNLLNCNLPQLPQV